jgi:hypothetical protein
LHDALPFAEVPIKVYYRPRKTNEDDGETHPNRGREVIIPGEEPHPDGPDELGDDFE